jgi:hypothetical protein
MNLNVFQEKLVFDAAAGQPHCRNQSLLNLRSRKIPCNRLFLAQ